MPKTSARSAASCPLTLDDVRALMQALPKVEEGFCYGTPAFRVSGKLLARMHQDGESLVLKVDLDARDLLTQSEPETYFVTDHYIGHPYMLVRLATVKREALFRLLEDAWRAAAAKRLVAAYTPSRHSP